MVAEFMGWQKHLHLRSESTWGVRSGSNPDIPIPYTNYSVATKVVATQADLFMGIRQRRHNRVQRATIEGTLSLPLFGQHVDGKSIAQHLLEWGISSPASPLLESKTADIFENNTDNKRHLGLRVRTMTLSGDADSGALTLDLDLDGKEEMGGVTTPSISPTTPQPVEFLFDDVEMYLSSDAEAESATASGEQVEIRSFRLQVENNLKAYHTNSFYHRVSSPAFGRSRFSSRFSRPAGYSTAFGEPASSAGEPASWCLRGDILEPVQRRLHDDQHLP